MSLKNAAINLVNEALEGRMDFLVLRGSDEWSRDGGDIDVLVPKGTSTVALGLVGSIAVASGWALAGIFDIGYLSQICLVKRWGDDGNHQAVKVDFFNGVSWVALGSDRWGSTLLETARKNREHEVVALVTLLQKFLYAGCLRGRDKQRIFSACTQSRIMTFIKENDFPLTDSDLERRRLGKIARWKLRAASADVTLAGLPVWIAKVAWRTLVFYTRKSTIAGPIIIIYGSHADRRAELADRFQSLFGQSGFPQPSLKNLVSVNWPRIRRLSPSSLLVWWKSLRGETVLLNVSTLGPAQPPPRPKGLLSNAIYIQLPDRSAGLSSEKGVSVTVSDLDALLSRTSIDTLFRLERS